MIFELSSISSFSLLILTIFIQLFSILEGNVCVAEIIDLRPATGKIGHPFNAVHKFSANLCFFVDALEFTFDLLHRAVQWSRYGAGQKISNLRYASQVQVT